MQIVDNYFPQWMVDKVLAEIPLIPVSYTNSPYGEYDKSRFFGQQLMEKEQWVAPIAPHWFVDYLHMAVCNDICKEYEINHLDRCLLNCQTPGQEAQIHTDSNSNVRISGIYHVMGDGDTVFYTTDKEKTVSVKFVPGRLVLFNSTIWHQGLPPVDSPIRYSLGYIWHCDTDLSEHDPMNLSTLPATL